MGFVAIINNMERPPKQFEFWPKKITLEELNEELRKAGNYGQKKGEDLVSKEDLTKVLEGEDVKIEKILSPKESAKKAREVLEKLKEREKRE